MTDAGRHQTENSQRADGVAVIGMSCLFPGAPDVDAYWRNILGGVDSVTDPPQESWDPALHYDPKSNATDRVYCKRGGYLGALATFDPLSHGIPPVAVGGEPDQWLALRIARAALADAGYERLDESVRRRTAVILGKGTYLNGGSAVLVQHALMVTQTLEIIKSLHPEYTAAELEALREGLKARLPVMGPEVVPGLIPNIVVGRIANRLDLMGPTYTVDAACASSLVAVRLALQALREGECDLALVGGAQVWMPIPALSMFCQLGALSRRQQIRPFDKDADGTLLGEGIGMVVLKRRRDAERDGDRIYAVIRGVGVASDGRGLSVMAPRLEGEELALQRAYSAAGIAPETVGLIEAHGTGTPVGDVTEVAALSRVFGKRQGRLPHCALGSVKSMISHTIPAAGVAGLIKVCLALHHKVLPPSLNCDEPNPKLGLESTHFYVNTTLRPWIQGAETPRRAGVNAFGFGGINAHVVLEEHVPSPGTARRLADHHVPWDSEVCLIEADSAEGLAEEARRWASTAAALAAEAGSPYTLTDVAYTLGRARNRQAHRRCLSIVASSLPDLREKLERAAVRLADPACRQIRDVAGIYFASEPLRREGGLAFLIPGEGAQYPNMLADLCVHLPEVRDCYDGFDRLFRELGRDYLPSEYLFPMPSLSPDERRWAEGQLWRIEGAIESVRVANFALWEVLTRLGIRPDAVVGHSSGEYAALQLTGIFDLGSESLVDVARELVLIQERAFGAGVPSAVLLALGTGRDQVEAIAREAGPGVYVAMDNCAHQVVLACLPEAAERVLALVRREGVIHETLPFDRPYHTPLFAGYAETLRPLIERLPAGRPSVPIYSCTSVGPFPEDPDAVRALVVDHWVRPVEFRRTIEALYERGIRLFVEAGPRGNLTTFVEDTLRRRRFCAVPANVQRRSGLLQLNHLVGLLAAHGVDVDTAYLFKHRQPRLVEPVASPRTAARTSAPMKLTTGFPPMALDDALVNRLRARAPIRAEAALPAAPVSPPVAPIVNVGGPTVPVIGDVLETMRQFLCVQEHIIRDCSGAAASEPPAVEYPLLGDIVALVPGESLVARRTFDPDQDIYLRDHALGRSVSDDDPELRGLMLLPLTMSLELLAEAAACLLSGHAVVGLRDVRAYRWIAFDDGPQSLEVRARRRPGDALCVDVQLHNVAEPQGPVVEAAVLLGAFATDRPGPRVVEGRPSRLRPDRLYTDTMFHGPRWQGVAAIERTGAQGTEATLRVLPVDRFLRDRAAPRFVLDPVALDAAGQVVGFWTAEHLERGQVVFPFRLDALDVFGPGRPAGKRLTCSAAIELLGGAQVRSDIDVAGADGMLWMRLTGWYDRRFDVPPRFLALVRPSGRGDLSEPWPDTKSEQAGYEALECRRMAVTPPPDAEFWSRVWAGCTLSRHEREVLRGLNRSPGEAWAWLAGRTAAKEAVRRLLLWHAGLEVRLADVAIDDSSGRPRALGAWLGALDTAPSVTIEFADGAAVARAGLPEAGNDATRSRLAAANGATREEHATWELHR